MCKHDTAYKIEHEAAGGVGCPLCNTESRQQAAPVVEVAPTFICPACGWDYADGPRCDCDLAQQELRDLAHGL